MPVPVRLGRAAAFMSVLTLALLASVPTAQATFPGASGRIAYTQGSDGNIRTINYDGTDRTVLTAGTDPQWSPDGSQIVFTRPSGIWVIDGDSSGEHQVRTTGRFPAWSPDGTKIVFTDGEPGRLYVMNSDGTDVVQLPVLPEPRTGWPDPYSGHLWSPAWSPDGQQIVYEDVSGYGHELFVVNIDGSGRQLLVPEDPWEGGVMTAAEWLPDGSRIAYFRSTPVNTPRAFTILPDGTGETEIAGDYSAPQPRVVWAPDGTKYAIQDYLWGADGLRQQYPYSPGARAESWQPIPADGANLAASMTVIPNPVYFGETAEFTVTVRHVTGTQTASAAVLTDTLPSQFDVVSANTTQGSCSISGQTVTCQLGDVGPGGLVTITITVAPVQTGFPVNTATVQSPTSDPDPVNNNASAAIRIENVAGFPRPKGATPFVVSLVPAYPGCTSPDLTHGPPLAFGSCSGPAPISPYLTVGTPDANGRSPNSVASERLDVIVGNPQTPADDADVRFQFSMTDVRKRADLTDYTGELQIAHTLRMTDRLNGTNVFNFPGTMTDRPFNVVVPCVATASPATGATCSVTTTADALVPDVVHEGKRAIWGLDQVRVFDGGADGVVSTVNNSLFAKQGLFIP